MPQVEGGTGAGLRDLRATTPQQLPLFSFPHQVMQETLLAAAENAGAEVRRGVSVEHIECGTEPTVIVNGHSHEQISARLIIAADGRNSAARKWAGFRVCGQNNGLYMAGVMLTNLPTPKEIFYVVFNPEIGTWTGLIPEVDDRFRAYLCVRGFLANADSIFPPESIKNAGLGQAKGVKNYA